MAWIFVLLGLAMAALGGAAMYIGWPMLPLERGWTLTLSGAFFASSGLVCLALSGVMAETKRMRRSLEREFAGLHAAAEVENASPHVAAPPASPPGAAPPSPAGEGRRKEQDGRSVTIGDTTFIAFEDGTIEARTPGGIRRFGSMQELRDHLKEQRDDAAG